MEGGRAIEGEREKMEEGIERGQSGGEERRGKERRGDRGEDRGKGSTVYIVRREKET